jgi:hypothetical protein
MIRRFPPATVTLPRIPPFGLTGFSTEAFITTPQSVSNGASLLSAEDGVEGPSWGRVHPDVSAPMRITEGLEGRIASYKYRKNRFLRDPFEIPHRSSPVSRWRRSAAAE